MLFGGVISPVIVVGVMSCESCRIVGELSHAEDLFCVPRAACSSSMIGRNRTPSRPAGGFYLESKLPKTLHVVIYIYIPMKSSKM